MLDGEYSINSTLFKINYFRGNYTSFETMLEPGQALLIMVKLGPMKDVDVRERPVVANGEVKLGGLIANAIHGIDLESKPNHCLKIE